MCIVYFLYVFVRLFGTFLILLPMIFGTKYGTS